MMMKNCVFAMSALVAVEEDCWSTYPTSHTLPKHTQVRCLVLGPNNIIHIHHSTEMLHIPTLVIDLSIQTIKHM